VNDWGSDVEKIIGQATHRRAVKSADCLSQAALDRLALGETAGAERERAQQHLATCAPCAEMKAFLDRDRAAFLVEANVDALAADALARASALGAAPAATFGPVPWWRKVVPALAVFAAATAALVLMPRSTAQHSSSGSGSGSGPGDSGLTAKGGFGLAVYVLHTEGAASAPAAGERGVLHLGEALHPGDRIRLQLSGGAEDRDGGRHPMVLAVDQTARVSVYFPPQAAAPSLSITASSKGAAVMAPSGPGIDLGETDDKGPPPGQLLPTAIELDDTLGRETIIALNCRAPVTLDLARAAVRDAIVSGAAGTTVKAGDLGLACQQARYVIEKVAR
jgi:hypothetical protein